jgi:hypothetical protein
MPASIPAPQETDKGQQEHDETEGARLKPTDEPSQTDIVRWRLGEQPSKHRRCRDVMPHVFYLYTRP